MFQRLRALFGRRDAFGYTAGARSIFHYHDGRRWRRGDPLALERALMTDPTWEPRTDPGVAQVPTAEGVKAGGRLIAATRAAFKIPDFEAGGLTDAECISLYAAFDAWLRKLMEEARPLPSSPTPSPASASADSVTETSADSGSPATVYAKNGTHACDR